ncbi:MAG TPA: hypothetical protein VJ650_12840 [Gemmatimonadaceae bacterium]|nr:hypothetical protein [Gemmatimonadaceae bacterium]
MRASFVAVSVVLASTAVSACRNADGDSIPRSVPGVYEYDAAGRAFGHPWSFHVALELHRDGRYEMTTDSDIDGDRDRDTDRGRYIVRDNVVYLSHGDSDRVDPNEAHRLDIRGDSLRADMPWVASAALRLAGASKPILVRRDRIGD